MKKMMFSLVCLCFLFGSIANGEQIKDLYHVLIPVKSSLLEARQEAMEEAMIQVLIKVSGVSAVAEVPEVARALRDPEKYVAQYSYQVIDNSEMLSLSFDRRAINTLLSKAKLAVWSGDRPTIVLWLAVDNFMGPVLVGNDGHSDLPQEITKTAKSRGLPLTFPLLDLTDLNTISPQDVINNNDPILLAASLRYGAKVALIGNLTREADQHWRGAWRFLVSDESVTWETEGDTEKANLDHVMDLVSQALVSRYGVIEKGSQEEVIDLVVSNIHDVNAYSTVIRYLKSLSVVKTVTVVSVSSDEVEYKITLKSNQEALFNAIALGKTLVAENNTHYRLVN